MTNHHTFQTISALVQRQRLDFIAKGAPSAEQRIEIIDRLIGLLVDNADEIADAVSDDFGHRSIDFSRVTEVLSPLGTLKRVKPKIADWMKPELRSSEGGNAWVRYQPKGVIGIMATWNFPMNLAFKGLADTIAAGNRVLIKPSEFTPRSSELLARLIGGQFDPEQISVVNGGSEVSQAFCAQPFDHLLFTGATSVGRQVMRAAADNLVPVTLELGGKSPAIISRSADMRVAVAKILTGKAHNAGQICLSPDYVFIPEERMDDFVSIALDTLTPHFPTLLNNPDYTSIINARHYARLLQYIQQAREAGVEVTALNPANEDFSNQPHYKMPITLLRDPGDELQVMQDEIFGPILPFKPYKRIEDVIDYVNKRPRPLALYWFGNDEKEEELVLDRTTSGGVTINNVIRHIGVDTLPFGGIGASGMGAYHGREGFLTFSHAKAVFRPVEGPDIMCPPFTANRDAVRSLITP